MSKILLTKIMEKKIDLNTPKSAMDYLKSLSAELEIELAGYGEPSTIVGDAVRAITGEGANQWAIQQDRWEWTVGELIEALGREYQIATDSQCMTGSHPGVNSFWASTWTPGRNVINVGEVYFYFSNMKPESKSVNLDIFWDGDRLGEFSLSGKGWSVLVALKKIITRNEIREISCKPCSEMRSRLYAVWAKRNGWTVDRNGPFLTMKEKGDI